MATDAVVSDRLERLAEVATIMRGTLEPQINAVVDVLTRARLGGNVIYAAGNGGSAATAGHFVNDLVNLGGADSHYAVKAVALTDATATLLAIANDLGYDQAFRRQLETWAELGDVIVVFSASGNSPNVVEAVAFARERGLRTIAFTGRGGGRLALLADIAVVVPSDSVTLCEDMHLFIQHSVIEVLQARQLVMPPSL